jgi:DNA repair exonuclease SbcCD nuclease subunit
VCVPEHPTRDIIRPVITLAHLSDTHLGYEAYARLSPTGINQRGVDIAGAFVRVCADIRTWDPPLVVHSGDLAERPTVGVNALLLMRRELARLAEIRPDGTRRQVVIISGNHDTPSARRDNCYLALFADLPGVHVVTDDYTTITFDPTTGAHPDLADITVHAVPHDMLKTLAVEERFDEITPRPGRLNLLVAHGVAGGSKLYKRVQGREYAIPTDVLNRPWNYAALGHWHRRGPVGGAASRHAWYAGSSENMGFGDLIDNSQGRGYLRVEIDHQQPPQITPVDIPIRDMYRLPHLDATGRTPQEITGTLLSHIDDARNRHRLAEAVVGQIVSGCSRELWSLVDVKKVRAAAADALHFELTFTPPQVRDDDRDDTSSTHEPDRVMAEAFDSAVAGLDVDPTIRAEARQLAWTLLQQHLDTPTSDDETDDNSDPAPGKAASRADNQEVAA